MDGCPFISVVIPVRNEQRYMPQCTASLRDLDYPRDRYEVIFSDGRSTDDTVAMARAAGHSVVDNPGLRVASGRDVGFAASKGELVAFTDADCVFDRDWLRNAVRHFQNPDVGGLSGPTRVPPGQNSFGKAVGLVFDLAGMAGTTVHLNRVDGIAEVDDLPGCNAFYRREVLSTVLPLNTNLPSNEDVEMNARVRRNGFRLWMTPDVAVNHFKRTSPTSFCKQMFRFARDRARLGKTDPSVLRPGHLIIGLGGPILLIAFAMLALKAPTAGVAVAGLGLLAALLMVSVTARQHNLAVAGNLLLALLILALTWTSGFLFGLFLPRANRPPAHSMGG